MQPSEERLQELEALCDDSTDERVRDYYFRAERALMAFPELLAAYRELAEALKSDGVFQVLAEIGLTRMWTDETVNYLMQATEKAYSLSRALRGEKVKNPVGTCEGPDCEGCKANNCSPKMRGEGKE